MDAATTLTASDEVVLADATSGVVAVTLPGASAHPGKAFTVKKTDASGNAVNVATADGGTEALTSQYDAVSVVSDGSAWHVTGRT